MDICELVRRTEDTFRVFCKNPPNLCGYFIALESQLRAAGTRFSPRRLSTLFRTALGIQAARVTLGQLAGNDSVPDLETTLFLAFSHGHPGLTERSLDRAALLTLHRQAWNIGGLQEDDPWRHLLQIPDPVERVAVASQAGFPLSEADLSSLVLEAVASQKGDEKRSAVALIIYLKFRAAKKIAATAAETLAGQLGNILRPRRTTHQVYGTALERCRRVASLCSTLRKTPRDQYIRNLLNGFLPDGYKSVQPEELKVFAFSTVVSEIRGSDLRRASFANTQGTAINAVLNHAVSISTGRQPKVILVVTDGYVGPARSDLLTRLPKTRTVAALTAPGYEADLKP